MLQHKYKKTGKGLLGVIDKHIHATVAVIISTVVITTIIVPMIPISVVIAATTIVIPATN